MIKIETEKDGKINAAICGSIDEVIPEFFHSCITSQKSVCTIARMENTKSLRQP